MTRENEPQTEGKKRPVVPNRETIGPLFADVLQKKITRRAALGTGGKVAIGAAVAVVAAGGAVAYIATRPPNVVTTTATTTLAPSTVTSTATTTVPTTTTATTTATSVSTATVTSTGGPGVDYYYDPSLNGTTINYLAAALPEKPPIFNYIPLFEKETGITVNLEVLSETDVFTKAATVFAASSPQYDIVDAGWFGAAAYAWWLSGWLTPIQKFFDMTPSGWQANDFLPSVMAGCSTYAEDEGGVQLISLPIVCTICEDLEYRQDLFAAVGAPVPFPGTVNLGSYVNTKPITMDDYITWADKVNNPPNMIGYCLGGMPPIEDMYSWEPFVWMYNKNFIHKDFTPNFTDPDVIEGVKYWVKVLTRYIADPTTWNWTTATALETAGKIASWQGCSTDYGSDFGSGSTLSPETTRYAWAPGNVVSPQMLAGSTPAISAFSKKQNAAWSFYSWLKSPRMEELFFLAGNAPTRQSLLTNPTNLSNDSWAAQEVLQSEAWLANAQKVGTAGASLVYCNIFPKIPRTIDLCAQIGTSLGKVTAGQQSAEDAMNDCQTYATTLLKDIGFYGKKTYDFGT